MMLLEVINLIGVELKAQRADADMVVLIDMI
jgi:hypothetical protein